MGKFKYCKKCFNMTPHKIVEAKIIDGRRHQKVQCTICKREV
jgi:hypothetical protein